MAVFLRNYNIVRVTDGERIINCTVIKMCLDYAVIKYQGNKYKIPYALIDQVVGHELLISPE